MEVPPRIELGIRELQSHALPLGYGTKFQKGMNGASGRNRTTDTGIFSPLLYRLSYRGVLGTFRLELLYYITKNRGVSILFAKKMAMFTIFFAIYW